jgi:hypothetical protein
VLRDALRRFGFTADRVPSSGAAQGFKGDIRFSKDGVTYLAELKARKQRILGLLSIRFASDPAARITAIESFAGETSNDVQRVVVVIRDRVAHRRHHSDGIDVVARRTSRSHHVAPLR